MIKVFFDIANKSILDMNDFIGFIINDIILIKVVWFIRHNGIERIETKDEGTKEVIDPWKNLEVLIALPRYVKNYYFRLSGNYYNTTYILYGYSLR